MGVFLNRQCLLFTVAVILTVYTLSCSAVPAKEHHKKKLLDKLRSSLNQTESEEAVGDAGVEAVAAAAANATAAGGENTQEAKTGDDDSSDKGGAQDDEDADEETASDDKKADSKEKPVEKEKSEVSGTELQKQDGASSYLLKMRSVLKRLFDMFGFRQSKKKEGRQNRMLGDASYSYNGLEYEFFKDDIRTTVGAVLGEKECIQKIVCGAGSYLRDVNGKHVILTILENVTPSAWMDTMELLKKSAVTDGDCVYKCLESDQAVAAEKENN